MIVCEPTRHPGLFSDLTRPLENVPKPFLKWVGGKRTLAPHIAELMPNRINRYLEPFLGGGSVAFYLWERVGEVHLNDANAELINAYTAVRDDLPALMDILDDHANHHDSDRYYAVRSLDPLTLAPTQRAARLIYLNKNCFNGLYRVNRFGQFNVPLGSARGQTLYDKTNLEAVREFLKRCQLSAESYDTFLTNQAKPGDVVYLDPPYAPVSRYSDFKRYTQDQFRDDDQVELAKLYDWLVELGAYPILSNSCCERTRELYGKHLMNIVMANRAVNKDGKGRGAVPELLVQPRRSSWQ